MDSWSLGHFIGGVVGRVAVFPNNRMYSFLVSNGIHLFVEMIEKSPHPVTCGIESTTNHTGDVLFFLLGWIVGDIWINQYVPEKIRIVLLILFVVFIAKEIIRELYPPFVRLYTLDLCK